MPTGAVLGKFEYEAFGRPKNQKWEIKDERHRQKAVKHCAVMIFSNGRRKINRWLSLSGP